MFFTGMLRFRTVTSGLKCLACSLAFAPSSASSQTSIPADSKMMRRLRRTSGLSSTKKTHLGMSFPDDQQSLEGVRMCAVALAQQNLYLPRFPIGIVQLLCFQNA